ncbi:MAG: KpsF/GutQ family sugar-phosphate isomerase [Magnetococcales bacterium]|nr:KpsF/GutQ family sugar-phosphate isomerase [Magnetococcales bacterium]MBF0151277.1 KpsF/GutQ family sugar-phosphate isomerase [Magnetococcales bacterium]
MLDTARRTLSLEARAIDTMAARLDERFVRAVELLHDCRGRVVVTGMGKSGLIGQKIAATLSSTGTPSFYLHPAEGSHGDLGMLTRQDCIIALSNSGETVELIAIMPVIKRLGITLIGLLGRMDSTLARMSDLVLDVSVEREACPLGLAPTSSTTAALAMGDALAVSLLEKRGFNAEQFALFHPGGNLGKRLLLTVKDLMHTGSRIPLVAEHENGREAILEMTEKRFGMTGVINSKRQLVGIITDGDLRRHLERGNALLTQQAGELMTPQPKTIAPDALAVEALRKMEEKKITSLFVRPERDHRNPDPIDCDTVVGVIHLHDLLQAGLM